MEEEIQTEGPTKEDVSEPLISSPRLTPRPRIVQLASKQIEIRLNQRGDVIQIPFRRLYTYS